MNPVPSSSNSVRPGNPRCPNCTSGKLYRWPPDGWWDRFHIRFRYYPWISGRVRFHAVCSVLRLSREAHQSRTVVVTDSRCEWGGLDARQTFANHYPLRAIRRPFAFPFSGNELRSIWFVAGRITRSVGTLALGPVDWAPPRGPLFRPLACALMLTLKQIDASGNA